MIYGIYGYSAYKTMVIFWFSIDFPVTNLRSQGPSEVSAAELLCEGLAASAAAEVELEPLGEALEPWNGAGKPFG